MQFSQKRNQRSGCSAVKFYTPPKLHTGKDWYVDFYASDLMSRIFEELQAGWNPWIQAASGATYSTLRDACEAYEAYLSKLLQEDLLREKTCKGYRSYLNL